MVLPGLREGAVGRLVGFCSGLDQAKAHGSFRALVRSPSMASCHLAIWSPSCQLTSNLWSRTFSKASLCALAFEEVCPLSGQKHWQSSLCVEFLFL